MVKLDPNRDYYADLELPPTADVSDVKKQFRKLGMY
jgi:curved DNA-binding protein CbpA